MKYYYITGTSRGIGKAIANELLKSKQNRVFGFSRTCSIKADNYLHFPLDLMNLEAVKDVRFATLSDVEQVVLINNAASLGEIKYVGKIPNEQIVQIFTVNLIAPSILMNNFINAYSYLDCDKVIINASSGAGLIPLDGCSIYGSAKAALDMHSRTAQVEQKLSETPHPFRIYAISPGAVDTEMQGHLRSADPQYFRRLQEFRNYQLEGRLNSPEEAAKKYLEIIENPTKLRNVLYRLEY